MSMQLLTFKTPIGYNKAKPITECLRYFRLQKYRHCVSVKNFLPKHIQWWFSAFFTSRKSLKSR